MNIITPQSPKRFYLHLPHRHIIALRAAFNIIKNALNKNPRVALYDKLKFDTMLQSTRAALSVTINGHCKFVVNLTTYQTLLYVFRCALRILHNLPKSCYTVAQFRRYMIKCNSIYSAFLAFYRHNQYGSITEPHSESNFFDVVCA